MTDTKEKLLAAKYFLGQMLKNRSEHDAFKYNLGAFLAEARSVTLVMQTEFSKTSGFEQWYNEKQTKMQNDSEMKLLNDKRVMTVHQKPVRPSAHINISINEHLLISDRVSIEVIRADGTVERSESEPEQTPHRPVEDAMATEWQWYFKELPDKDVVATCREHIGKLELLVEECESKFSLLYSVIDGRDKKGRST